MANDDDAKKNRHCSKFDEIDYNDMVNCIATHNHAIESVFFKMKIKKKK